MRTLETDVESLQNLLISVATGGSEKDIEYTRLRKALLANPALNPLIPEFLRNCRSANQFWQFIKRRFPTYAERRNFIWQEFLAIHEAIDRGLIVPSDSAISSAIQQLDAAHVQVAWSKALERRASDPEGAITSSRTLIESVCKHILDASQQVYDDGADLPRLYKQTAELLNLAPSQHTEQIFKQILGGCTSIVEGLGALRNRLSDAHGKGKVASRPAPRHAELAVNLSGALAMYLLATWHAKKEAAT